MRFHAAAAVIAVALGPLSGWGHGSYDHDVIGAVALERAGAPGSVGDRIAMAASGTAGADGGTVVYQRLLLTPVIIGVDCVTTFSYAGHHVATVSGTAAGGVRYSFQIDDADGPDVAQDEVRIGVSTQPMDPQSCWAPANVSFEVTRSAYGSLDVL